MAEKKTDISMRKIAIKSQERRASQEGEKREKREKKGKSHANFEQKFARNEHECGYSSPYFLLF